MYRSGPNFEFVEKHVPKWYVPKWSCTDLALTQKETRAAWEIILGPQHCTENSRLQHLHFVQQDKIYYAKSMPFITVTQWYKWMKISANRYISSCWQTIGLIVYSWAWCRNVFDRHNAILQDESFSPLSLVITAIYTVVSKMTRHSVLNM